MRKLVDLAHIHLGILAGEIGERPVGSANNRKATGYCVEVLRKTGYDVQTPEFDCLHWEETGADCSCDGCKYTVTPSPYSNGCDVEASLQVVRTLSDLQTCSCAGQVLLVAGELAAEQLMPKGYPYYNPETHQLIVGLLEQKAPAVIIAATARNPELAGAVYPFPLIEDGNFEIPSVYTTDVTGVELAKLAGRVVKLTIRAVRIPSTACNVIARKPGYPQKKVVLCAHVDTKIGTPGALDNAAGVTTLLLTAELLKKEALDNLVEFLVMNGEDYYGANGEKNWMTQNEGQLTRIASFINLDALGYRKGRTAFSFYNQPEEKLTNMREVLTQFPGICEGETWYQSDHAVLVMQGIPAAAVTSEFVVETMQKYIHTSKDVVRLVDVQRLVEAAHALTALIKGLESLPA